MSEKVLEINSINPLDLYGANNKKLTFIKQFFPKIKNFSRVEKKMDKIENQDLKNSLNNFLKAFDERNK